MKDKWPIRFAEYPSPLGLVLIAGGARGITDVTLSGGRVAFLSRIEDKYGRRPQEDRASFKEAFAELDIYFSKRPIEFTLPLDVSGTAFEMKVWRAIRGIPWGSTLSYKEIAGRIGNPGAARAAGGACGKNPVPLIIPCHRVLGSNGSLGGYTGGIDIKKRLLAIEGVKFCQNSPPP